MLFIIIYPLYLELPFLMCFILIESYQFLICGSQTCSYTPSHSSHAISNSDTSLPVKYSYRHIFRFYSKQFMQNIICKNTAINQRAYYRVLFPFQYPTSKGLLNFHTVGKIQKENGNYPRTATWLWRKYQIAGNSSEVFLCYAVIMNMCIRCLYLFFPVRPTEKNKILLEVCTRPWRLSKDQKMKHSLSGASTMLVYGFLLH